MKGQTYSLISETKAKGKKQLAVLIDPDHVDFEKLPFLISSWHKAAVDYVFVGGSLLTTDKFHQTVRHIKKGTDIPVIIFPGSTTQITSEADAFLMLSLLSGRNADLLIGKHVEAVPALLDSNLEIISTAYLLIDGGKATTASYISNSSPIPADKPEIAACTAVAGEMLGFKTIYLDAGSGAATPVSAEMISLVKSKTGLPIIVGGGINTPQKAAAAYKAGADIIVIGNVLEKNPEMLDEFVAVVFNHSMILS